MIWFYQKNNFLQEKCIVWGYFFSKKKHVLSKCFFIEIPEHFQWLRGLIEIMFSWNKVWILPRPVREWFSTSLLSWGVITEWSTEPFGLKGGVYLEACYGISAPIFRFLSKWSEKLLLWKVWMLLVPKFQDSTPIFCWSSLRNQPPICSIFYSIS